MKKLFVICYSLIGFALATIAKTPSPTLPPGVKTSGALTVEVADVSDPGAIKLKTSDQGTVICGTLHDCIANYPQLKDGMITETAKKLETEDEIAAQHRMQILNGQKIDIPKAAVDKHNARIAKFAKAKEDALVKVAKTNPSRAKAKQAELIAAGIPISDATKKAVEAAQPKPTPTPAPVASATPNDGL